MVLISANFIYLSSPDETCLRCFTLFPFSGKKNFLFKLYRLPCLFGNLIPANKKAGAKPAVSIWFVQVIICCR